MRFMIILKGNEQSEAGVMPSEKMLTDMTRFNEELVDAGVMIGGDGLHPSSEGTVVKFENGKPSVVNGATKGLIAGFWIWKVNALDDAIEWVKRIPDTGSGGDGEIEIRQIFEIDEFGDNLTPEVKQREERMQQKIADQNAKAASGR
ncbi:MAG: YciI family protein [Acidobacteriota bacterium]